MGKKSVKTWEASGMTVNGMREKVRVRAVDRAGARKKLYQSRKLVLIEVLIEVGG
jgi:hypothetical protein